MRDGTISLDGSNKLTPAVGYLGSELIRVLAGSPSGSGRKRRQASVETLTAVVDITTASSTMSTTAVDSVVNGITFTNNIFVMPSPSAVLGYCRKEQRNTVRENSLSQWHLLYVADQNIQFFRF